MKFYKKTVITAILFLCYHLVCAQIITGVVCDHSTKLPVSDVYVYLDGTSIHSITNSSGKFELVPNSVVNTKLVLHHLSYETAFIEHPFQKLPDTLFIKSRLYVMPEITILADRFTRKQKMKAFREQFLGMSRAGRSCTIANEDDIQLRVDMENRRLLATSDKPIVVVNDYLGYKISFILIDFWVQYGVSVVNLDNDDVHSSFFSVVSLFINMVSDNKKIKRRRDNVYENSSNHFFKSWVNDALKDNHFILFNRGLPIDYRHYFSIKDTLSQKILSIIPETNYDTSMNTAVTDSPRAASFGIDKGENMLYTGPDLSGKISVLHRKKARSDIYFMTDFLLIDRYGNIDPIDEIAFGGQMGTNRAGDMLPIDYEPGD